MTRTAVIPPGTNNHKGNSMKLLNYSQLAELTGKTFRTVKARLVGTEPVETRGRGVYFNSRAALPLIYGIDNSGELDLAQERARLSRLQADAQEMKNKKTAGELIDLKEVLNTCSQVVVAARNRLMGVHAHVAPIILGSMDDESAHEIIKMIEDTHREALNSLAHMDEMHS